MAWLIELDTATEKDIEKLDRQIGRRIIQFLRRLQTLDDPRSIGEALVGSKFGNYWKYRVGDYRIIADIQDK